MLIASSRDDGFSDFHEYRSLKLLWTNANPDSENHFAVRKCDTSGSACKRRAKTALDVKMTINVRSAESAGVPASAQTDHRNYDRKSQVLFIKGIASSKWLVDLTK